MDSTQIISLVSLIITNLLVVSALWWRSTSTTNKRIDDCREDFSNALKSVKDELKSVKDDVQSVKTDVQSGFNKREEIIARGNRFPLQQIARGNEHPFQRDERQQ